MATHKINSDSLGDTTTAAAERFARFCTVVAEKAGFSIDFEIDYNTAGYTPNSVGREITNLCWDCYWYNKEPLRKDVIDGAVSLVMAFVDNDEE